MATKSFPKDLKKKQDFSTVFSEGLGKMNLNIVPVFKPKRCVLGANAKFGIFLYKNDRSYYKT